MNQPLYDLINGFFNAAAENCPPLPTVDLYQRYQMIRSTFTSNTLPDWVAWTLAGTILALFVLLVLISPRASREVTVHSPVNHPQKLFDEILQSLELASEEKHLLREMVEGARLQHPAMSLLSPRLLDSARAAWRKERGDANLSPLKLQQMDTICCKLYDHLPPSSVAFQAGADEQICV